MQWDGQVNAGFTEGTSSWLPVNPDYQSVNVEVGICVTNQGSENIVMHLFCSDFLVGAGSVANKNKLQGGKQKGMES